MAASMAMNERRVLSAIMLASTSPQRSMYRRFPRRFRVAHALPIGSSNDR